MPITHRDQRVKGFVASLMGKRSRQDHIKICLTLYLTEVIHMKLLPVIFIHYPANR